LPSLSLVTSEKEVGEFSPQSYLFLGLGTHTLEKMGKKVDENVKVFL
jgi:hypothetical protein